MKAKNKVVYVPPVYEEVQHEITSVDDNNNPLRTSFHTDVSLLQRIDNMRVDAQTIREIKESLQPMIDTSNLRAQFEETFGSLTDDELINSVLLVMFRRLAKKCLILENLLLRIKKFVIRLLLLLRRKRKKKRLKKKMLNFSLVYWKSLSSFAYVV